MGGHSYAVGYYVPKWLEFSPAVAFLKSGSLYLKIYRQIIFKNRERYQEATYHQGGSGHLLVITVNVKVDLLGFHGCSSTASLLRSESDDLFDKMAGDSPPHDKTYHFV